MSFHMRTFTAEKLLISPAAGLDVMNCVECGWGRTGRLRTR